MLRRKANKRTFQFRDGSFKDAYAFAGELLTRRDINDETAKEALLIFEALMQRLIDWGVGEDADVEISGAEKLGEFRIRVGFSGKMFVRDDDDTFSVEDRILDGYDDRLDYSYHSGYNIIVISVSRSNRTSLFACAIASLCAVAVYIPLSLLTSPDMQHNLLDGYVFPLETMYGNAMLMIGAPMTFFSLLKNLTDTYVVAQRDSDIRQIQVKTLATSALAILLAFVAFFFLSTALLSHLDVTFEGSVSVDRTFADIVTSFMPPSIFEPFESVSPVPLMAVAFLCVYALCSVGKYFDPLRSAMMACYTLFSRMLHVVIAALPVFCFLAIMDVMLDEGFRGVIVDIFVVASLYVSVVLLYATYAIRLRAHGIKVIPFVQKLIPLLRENSRIGSAMNAAPYNIRYCSRTFKMKRAMLERNLPVLAETNLDGNCFVLMLLILLFVYVTNTHLSWISLAGLAVLTLFLSLGAPNQPGSILIGTLIVITYLNSPDMVCVAIFAEAFFGSAQNLINVMGDIVMVAIEDKKEKAAGE